MRETMGLRAELPLSVHSDSPNARHTSRYQHTACASWRALTWCRCFSAFIAPPAGERDTHGRHTNNTHVTPRNRPRMPTLALALALTSSQWFPAMLSMVMSVSILHRRSGAYLQQQKKRDREYLGR